MTGKRVYDLWSEIATQFTCAEGTVELNHRRGLFVTEPWLISLKMLIYFNANPQSCWGIAGTLTAHSYAHAQNWCQAILLQKNSNPAQLPTD